MRLLILVSFLHLVVLRSGMHCVSSLMQSNGQKWRTENFTCNHHCHLLWYSPQTIIHKRTHTVIYDI